MRAWQRWRLRRRLLHRLPDCTRLERVLVLCTANRVRSPFAGQYLRGRLPASVHVSSRGVIAAGSSCPGEAIAAASAYDVDLTPHEARVVSLGELLRADIVLVMEIAMAHDLAVRYPAIERTLVPLSFFDDEQPMRDIDDPYMLPPSEYDVAYERIARCCEGLLRRMPRAANLETITDR